MAEILDSGNRTEFETGAVRDIQEGKGREDLMPLLTISEIITAYKETMEMPESPLVDISYFMQTGDKHYLICAVLDMLYDTNDNIFNMLLELGIHYENGAKKYGENNWQKGIPVQRYIDSGVRHYYKYYRGDTDENHLRAFYWNMVCAIWTVDNKPDLNCYGEQTNVTE